MNPAPHPRHESVRGNLGYLVLFPSTEQRTAEEISKLLGDRTLYVETRSRSTGATLFASRRGTTLRDQRRPLLTPDEVRRLGEDRPILLVAGAQPIFNRMAGYFRVRQMARRARLPPPARPSRASAPGVEHWMGRRAVVPERSSPGTRALRPEAPALSLRDRELL